MTSLLFRGKTKSSVGGELALACPAGRQKCVHLSALLQFTSAKSAFWKSLNDDEGDSGRRSNGLPEVSPTSVLCKRNIPSRRSIEPGHRVDDIDFTKVSSQKEFKPVKAIDEPPPPERPCPPSPSRQERLRQMCSSPACPTAPFLASPDRLIVEEFAESEPGLLEVKCMPSIRGRVEDQVGKKSSLCLRRSPSGGIQLSRAHSYHYQVQGQLACTGRLWCDFVVMSSTKHILLSGFQSTLHFGLVCNIVSQNFS